MLKISVAIDILLHLFLSFLFAGVIFVKTGNLSYAAIFMLAGVFIDLDHFFDYFVFSKKFILADFIGCRYTDSGKVYLFLHSWELVFLILAAALVFNSGVLLVLFASLSLHLAIDNLQRQNPLFYFLIYRFYKKFDAGILLPERRK